MYLFFDKISPCLWQSKEANAFTQSSTPVRALVKALSGLMYCLVAVYWHDGHYDWCLCHVKAGPAVQGEESSLLLSPSVFQHSMTKTAEPLKNPASPTSPTADLPSSLYSRTQLKDTLIHLIKVQTDICTLTNQQWRRLVHQIILVFNCLPIFVCRMMLISSVQSMRPTFRASLKASTTSSYSHKLRKQKVPAGAVSDSAWSLTTSITLTTDRQQFPSLLCALSLSFPISILIYVYLPISLVSVIFPAQLCAQLRVLCNMKHCLFGELLFIYDPALDVWIWYGIPVSIVFYC